MKHKPLNLTVSDFTETRLSGYHAHWPVDPDTTARLDRVTQSDPYAQLSFRHRYRVNPLVIFSLVVLAIGVLLLIVSRWI